MKTHLKCPCCGGNDFPLATDINPADIISYEGLACQNCRYIITHEDVLQAQKLIHANPKDND